MQNYHIGCGYKIGENWVNFDSSPIAFIDNLPFLNKIIKINKLKFPKGIKYGNIVKRPLCSESSADNIYCSHVLEHVSNIDAKKMLKNIYFMLKKNGVFRIVVPSLESRIDEYNIDKDANKFLDSLGFFNKNDNKNILSKLRFFFGGSRHRWMYDKSSLQRELEIIGFKDIRKCEFGDSGLSIFTEVEDKDRFFFNNGKSKELSFQCTK